MNYLFKKLILVSILLSSSMGLSAATPTESLGFMKEAHVLSLTLDGNFLGSMVVRPCGQTMECENLLVRIDGKTLWANRGQALTYREAKTLDWNFVLLTVDKFNNALSIDRML